jgi:membrane protein DedA with SNARE-associated domain
MSEALIGLVASYGAVVIFAAAFLSCLALPIPTSLMMLTGGAFVASGDLSLGPVLGAAFAGAVSGDQAGYMLGRFGGASLVDRLTRSPARRSVLARARALIDRRGSIGVFLSTWAVAPLGPWVNFIAGTTGFSWARFTLWDVLGEAVWVVLYVGLGYGLSTQVAVVANVMGNVMGLLAALLVAAGVIFWIRGVLKAQAATPARPS